MVDLFRYRHWDLVSKRGLYYVISGLMLLVGLIAWCTVGLNEGIDFKGGGSYPYNLAAPLPESQGRQLADAVSTQLKIDGYTGDATYSPSKIAGVKDQILVRILLTGNEKGDSVDREVPKVTKLVNDVALKYLPPTTPGFAVNDEQLVKKLTTGANASSSAVATAITGANASASATNTALAAGNNAAASAKVSAPLTTASNAGASATNTALNVTPAHTGAAGKDTTKWVVQLGVDRSKIDGVISAALKRNGILAAILGSTLILFWIAFRYNIGGLGWKYAWAGIIALGHDLLTLVGMTALLRIEVNAPFVAAILTVLGFSVHDTIVIFDRIRENMRLRKGRTFAETVNISLLETMARSVNTVATVVFTLLALLFFGGDTLRPFVEAMLIGVVVGAYSSIFIASQLLVSWAKAKDKVMLPPGEAAPLAVGTKVAPMAQPATAMAGTTPSPAAPGTPSTPASREAAIQRAREAGRTSRRRR